MPACIFVVLKHSCKGVLIVNNRCSTPLHTIIADIIDSQGGTSLLIQTLNKLGVCVSLDTLSRSIQAKCSANCTQRTDDVDEECFFVVSVVSTVQNHAHCKETAEPVGVIGL